MPVDVVSAVNTLAWMLFGAAILGALALRAHLPYAVALVLGGILAEETHLLVLPQLEPSVLLFVFLPPLLFDAAFRLDDKELRTVARPVALLAIPGTVATAAIVALVLVLTLHLPLALAFLFGSIVSATDPVAVIAVFRGLNAPNRLSVIAEGESLINDGVAITLYTVALGLTTAGSADIPAALGFFLREVVGGVAIGVTLGLAFSRLTATVDDHLIEMTLSTALAYGSFLVAQSLETSGALACVAAGLIHGSYGRQVGMSENTRRLLDDLWEYFGFVANAIVFLLVGFTTNLASLVSAAGPVGVSILAVVLSRAVVIFGPPVVVAAKYLATSQAERAVLFWGGLRGALTITLALALPPTLANRELLIAMAFGVVLFSLVVQGVTLTLVVQRAGLARTP
ncbi:MAG TPA: cation:proton antiporter [Chloroflexota bacterium]|jgi:CPA1 family monovalent cation:H+ antiporter|nr:cation:proton antiporter [Chloroflexota bacterium]